MEMEEDYAFPMKVICPSKSLASQTLTLVQFVLWGEHDSVPANGDHR